MKNDALEATLKSIAVKLVGRDRYQGMARAQRRTLRDFLFEKVRPRTAADNDHQLLAASSSIKLAPAKRGETATVEAEGTDTGYAGGKGDYYIFTHKDGDPVRVLGNWDLANKAEAAGLTKVYAHLRANGTDHAQAADRVAQMASSGAVGMFTKATRAARKAARIAEAEAAVTAHHKRMRARTVSGVELVPFRAKVPALPAGQARWLGDSKEWKKKFAPLGGFTSDDPGRKAIHHIYVKGRVARATDGWRAVMVPTSLRPGYYDRKTAAKVPKPEWSYPDFDQVTPDVDAADYTQAHVDAAALWAIAHLAGLYVAGNTQRSVVDLRTNGSALFAQPCVYDEDHGFEVKHQPVLVGHVVKGPTADNRGPDRAVHFQAHFFAQALKGHEFVELSFGDEVAPALLRTAEKHTHILMPKRAEGGCEFWGEGDRSPVDYTTPLPDA
jgi:hypothetical protein